MTFDQVVAYVRGVDGLEGCNVGDRWEGHTDNQLRVDVFAKKNVPGVTLLWEYHDGQHRHQCGKNSVKRSEIDDLMAQIREAVGAAVPGRYVQEVEVETAAVRDPALLEAARLRGEEPSAGITREAFEEVVRVARETAERVYAEPQKAGTNPSGFVEAVREPDQEAPEHEEGFDPSIEEARRVQAAETGPVEVDVEDGPPPEEQEHTGVDQDVEDEADQG